MRAQTRSTTKESIEYKVKSRELPRLFILAAEGMFSLLTGGKTHNKAGMGFLVYKKLKVLYLKEKISCRAESVEKLLINWLTSLLKAYQKKEILFQDFDIQKLSETEIQSTCYGPLIDDVAEPKLTLDQVRFHKVTIIKDRDRFEALIGLKP